MKLIRILSLAVLAGGFFANASSAQSFGVSGSGDRANHWEIFGGLRPVFSETVDFDGGSTIDTDDDLGFAFGFGYNIDEHLLVGGEMAWSSIDYDGTVRSADTPGSTASLSGEFDTFALSGNLTYHFMEGPLTPYASATLGYTWVDSNIATGPPVTGCWWDPWFGYICDTFVDTKTEESFNYGLGVGVRWDFARGWFGRLSYEQRWFSLDEADGTPTFGGLHIDVGSKF